mmetsp:Transcript_17483/g.47693  ORF Transcript_17483/g.47693 Transcript_17483/m.47693 type:complete len:138 (+) Transcript_17483:1879-2292(+)
MLGPISLHSAFHSHPLELSHFYHTSGFLGRISWSGHENDHKGDKPHCAPKLHIKLDHWVLPVVPINSTEQTLKMSPVEVSSNSRGFLERQNRPCTTGDKGFKEEASLYMDRRRRVVFHRKKSMFRKENKESSFKGRP